jgi:hypothetical protein
VRIKLRYPASPENAGDHAQIAVGLAREGYDTALDFSPESLELGDAEYLPAFFAAAAGGGRGAR